MSDISFISSALTSAILLNFLSDRLELLLSVVFEILAQIIFRYVADKFKMTKFLKGYNSKKKKK